MNGNSNCLSDRNTFFIYDTDERGSGLEENLRLSSLIFAYLRLSSLIFAYLRLSSLILAYSRLMGEKCLREMSLAIQDRICLTGSEADLAGLGRRFHAALHRLARRSAHVAVVGPAGKYDWHQQGHDPGA